MTNFDYLLKKKEYSDFAAQTVEAEESITISPATCAILSRRALELAVRFVFSYDADLKLPYQDNISSLIHEWTFRDIIERDFSRCSNIQSIWEMLRFIRTATSREMRLWLR